MSSLRRALAALALLALLSVSAWLELLRPPPAAWFAEAPSHLVLDRHGAVLARRVAPSPQAPGSSRWVQLPEVAPALLDALLASEDQRFYDHGGLDARAIARAAWVSLRQRRLAQGGSTLTQQTARLLAGRPPGLPGKALEAWRALRLERHLEKRAILEWYLNRVYFGRGAYGIAAAAERVFDESPASLSVAESALLVGLLPAPERHHPEVSLAAARFARDRVLSRMVATGRLSQAERERALGEPIELRQRHNDDRAPHFVARVLDEHPDEPVLHTTLDARLQRQVEERVDSQLAELEGLEVDHAAVLVVDVPSGEVLAWVGSGGWHRKNGQFDAIRGRRSPGSALKPFVYALALEAGWRPSDTLLDIPRRYQTRHGSWAPENYDRTFRGPLRLRDALATSANLPAVQLLESVGASTLHSRLREAGFDLPEATSHYGLGLALGDAEVTLQDLTLGYAALARGGCWRPAVLVQRDGPREPCVPLVDPGAAAVVADILADPVARAPVFGRGGPLERPYRVSAKTGTSTGYRDNWTVGFTDRYAVGVWVGNFDGRPMGDVSGVTGAGPLWASVMDLVTAEQGARRAPPPGWERKPSCALSGGTPNPDCPHRVEDWAPAGAPERPVCAWHGPGCVAWPPELVPWARDAGLLQEGAPPCAPAGTRQASDVRIVYPEEGAVLYLDPRIPGELQRVALRATAPAGVQLDWWVDGQHVGQSQPGEAALWRPSSTGRHEVAVSAEGGRQDTRTVEIRGEVREAIGPRP